MLKILNLFFSSENLYSGRFIMLRYALLFVFLFVPVIFAQTNVSGSISSNTTWDVAGSPYIVTGNITVNNGVTLTVNSNVTVKFSSNTSMTVLGTLTAQSAIFTSNAGSPAAGDWRYIQVGSSSISGSVSLTDCDVQYGGTSSFPYAYGMLYAYRGDLNINNCDISFSRNYGILVWTPGTVSLTDSRIFSSDWPLAYNGAGDINFLGTNDLTGNTHDGIYMNYSTTSTSMFLEKINVPYVYLSGHTISQNTTVEVASTNIIKFGIYSALNVNGTLIAAASTGEKIYFTAYTNDNIGGDTNGDGSGSSPASQYWYYVKFNDTSNDGACILNRCDFSYGGRGNNGVVVTENASPTVENCEFSNNYYGLMLKEVSDPILSTNTIGSSDMVPIAMSIEADPEFDANVFSFSDNNYDAIGLLGGTLQDDANLPRRNVVDVENITYLLLGDITVPAGKTLSIEKGIVIKGYSASHRIKVRGKLTAIGSAEPDSMITFTSAKDDNHGNPKDTNKDGTQTVPVVGDWAGIVFENGSDPTSILQYCRVKYGKLPSESDYNREQFFQFTAYTGYYFSLRRSNF
jgi:parallel beta-helix repeat protein